MSESLQKTNGAAVATAPDTLQQSVYESLALKGDISGLSPQDKVRYMQRLCESLGLNPYTQPFLPLTLSGKEVLYATRGCTDQLSFNHKLTREIIKTEKIEGVYLATAKVTGPDGRFDISTGAVTIMNLKGDALANALMKAETKAKRRATLCYCGLGFLDETEIETIPASRVEYPATKGQVIESAKKEIAETQQIAGQTVKGPAFSGPPAGAIGEKEFIDLCEQIRLLGNAVGVDPTPTLNHVGEKPADLERAYCKVAREGLKKLFESPSWNLTDEQTLTYLERFGITELDKASRGQYFAFIQQLINDGDIPIA